MSTYTLTILRRGVAPEIHDFFTTRQAAYAQLKNFAKQKNVVRIKKLNHMAYDLGPGLGAYIKPVTVV